MSLLFPGYRRQRNRNRKIDPARGGPGAFSLLAVFVIFWIGALGYPQVARAQNDAPGSRDAVVPTVAVDAAAPETQKIEKPNVEPGKVDAPKDAPAAAKAATPSAGDKSYIIGPNDVLQVKVWNQPQISAMVDVHLDGKISLQLAGEIKADGLTTLQLRDAITKRLEEVALTAPVVDVSVLKINSKHYAVYGGVQRPGEFTLAEKITIMDALSLCGFKDFAKENKIELRRGKEKFLFNYKDYIKGKNMDKNINYELRDGDQIIVPE